MVKLILFVEVNTMRKSKVLVNKFAMLTIVLLLTCVVSLYFLSKENFTQVASTGTATEDIKWQAPTSFIAMCLENKTHCRMLLIVGLIGVSSVVAIISGIVSPLSLLVQPTQLQPQPIF